MCGAQYLTTFGRHAARVTIFLIFNGVRHGRPHANRYQQAAKTEVMKLFFKILLSFFCLSGSAQINHIFGIDGGFCPNSPYSFYSYPIINYKYELNATYTFNYKFLGAKIEEGIMPATEFGNIYRTFVLVGFNINPKKLFSFHHMLGFGGYKFDKPSITYESGNTVHVDGNGGIMNIGILINPTKQKKLAFGLDFYLTSMNSYIEGYHIPYPSSPLTLRISIKFLLSIQKKSETK